MNTSETIKIIGIAIVITALSIGFFNQIGSVYAVTSFGDELKEKFAMALLQDRKEGFEDGQGPNFEDTVNEASKDLGGSGLSETEQQIELIIAQNYLENLTSTTE